MSAFHAERPEFESRYLLKMKSIKAFEVYETVAISITNPGHVARIKGSPDKLERLLAFAIQSGQEVVGISEEERQKYLKMDLDI